MRSMSQNSDHIFKIIRISGYKEGSTFTIMDTLKARGIRKRLIGPIGYLGKKTRGLYELQGM